MIEVQNVSKSFEREVLKNISFSAEEGEVVFITGESGIGKTTLLHIMMGLIKSDSGRVSGVSERQTCVFQENRLLERLTVLDNLKFVSDMTDDDLKKECREILPEEVLYQQVIKLSGGMKRRVAILRAMIADADIIFMDEPFTGMDEATKARVIAYIQHKKENRTLIIVTHNKKEIDMFDANQHVHIG